MDTDYLLASQTAKRLFNAVRDLPIIDYHCHLSPKEIFENRPFDNIGEIWLAGDHYKWRLMRSAGTDEYYITGEASWRDKFLKYAATLEFAAGNPLYHWSHMELSMFFGIDEPLTAESAEKIWQKANACIKENRLSPRNLIAQSGVEAVCTTDDITDSLEWHEKIVADSSFHTRVLPSFRTDNLLLARKDGYREYIVKLSEVSGVGIACLEDLKRSVSNRLNFFVKRGCRFTDVGIPYFPDRISDDQAANEAFQKVLAGELVTDSEYLGLIGNLYLFLGGLYQEKGLVMQWHLAVYRNANTRLFSAFGADCGADCVGDTVNGARLIKMLDALNERGGLPRTILYTLNSANAAQIASVAGAFPNVRCGAAWWFCDHKRGIEEEINIIAENSSLGAFLGMLTDSRSFLSYARHDYFRRILCGMLGEWAQKGEYPVESAERLARKICYFNIKELVGE